ncbi:sel1 repeat family protein [Lysobacter silvisoli]|uniref:Sel1 repeat family protein n=1 Tax=Lysobacter silvisoli TaxID=2293254 RepID=A0A371JXQ1_9GAMM|nr:sel1 repeat family protein [Lysobacter silvisoli]RDZ26443.1 sel1 repeat family protein [Lysobacter silvisoli]
MDRPLPCLPLLLAILLPLTALAAPATEQRERALNFDTYHAAVLQSAGHPNELHRWHGVWAYDNGRYDEAIVQFRRAARYADKYSQHFLSMMYWYGEGAAPDRVEAYLWADLAAERGDNADLLEIREKIWASLSAEQQLQVAERGEDYATRYGDKAALPRINSHIRHFARSQTGSRVGAQTARLDIGLGRPDIWAGGGGSAVSTQAMKGVQTGEFYGAHRTRPDAYWKDQGLLLRTLTGQVEVGDVDKVEGKTPAPSEAD